MESHRSSRDIKACRHFRDPFGGEETATEVAVVYVKRINRYGGITILLRRLRLAALVRSCIHYTHP